MSLETPVLEFDPAKLAEMRTAAKLQRRMDDLRRANGMDFYRPHYKQHIFHIAGRKFRLGRTGNRFGKSDMGVAEDCAWARGERSWYKYKFDILNGKSEIVERHDGHSTHPLVLSGLPCRPTKGLIICADWDKAEEIFTSLEQGPARGKLFKMLPEGSWTYEKNQAGKIHKVLVDCIWGGKSTIYLDTVKSFASNKLGQESSDWDWIHVDEPCPEAMWEANSRGLMDRGGSAWFTCTPLTELWINDFFLDPSNIRYNGDEPIEKTDSKSGRTLFWMMCGSSYDNPYLKKENIEDFENTLSSDERETRILGRPRQLTGVVYSEFDHDAHILRNCPVGWKDILCPPDNACIRIQIDTHPKTPHAVLFGATMPTGHTIFFAEVFKHCLIRDLVNDWIKAILNGRPVMNCGVEPGAWVEHPTDGSSMATDLIIYGEGLPIEKASKDLSRGLLRTKQALRQRDARGIPFLLFHESLFETLYEIDRYVWDGDKEKPRDERDHMMECLYRMVIASTSHDNPNPGVFSYIDPTDQVIAPAKAVDYRLSLDIPGQTKSVASFRDILQDGQKVRTHSGKSRYRDGGSRAEAEEDYKLWHSQAARFIR